MNDETLQAIKAHAAYEFGDGTNPRECCGVVIVRKGREAYIPCRNIAGNPTDQFKICPEDYAEAEDQGEVVCIVHSHPYASPQPTEADLIGCEASKLPWFIINWPVGTTHYFEPSGYIAPLIGRKFIHGIFDCYSLLRDYYKEVLDIELMDFEREELWWEKNQNLYMDNFKVAGFELVPDGLNDLQLHDVLLMQISSPVVNHAGIYIGDNMIMHHFMNRLSSREVYGAAHRRCTIHVVRYKGLSNA